MYKHLLFTFRADQNEYIFQINLYISTTSTADANLAATQARMLKNTGR